MIRAMTKKKFYPGARDGVDDTTWSLMMDLWRFVLRLDRRTNAQLRDLIGEEQYRKMGKMKNIPHSAVTDCVSVATVGLRCCRHNSD